MSERLMMTGGTGYLGQAVLRELVRSGRRVRVLVRDPSRLPFDVLDAIEVARGDLRDQPAVAEAAAGSDAIVHVAGIASDWVPDPRLFHEVNVTGTANVLAAARAAGVPRVLVTGTVMVLGPTDQLVEGTETTTPPDGGLILPYQASKARALELARFARSRTLSVGVVHPGALYGAGPLTDGNYLARVMQQLRDGGFPMLPRMHGERWCLAHVDDVARGHLLALERGDPDGEYILGGDNVTFDRMLEIIRDGLALPSLPPRVPGGLMLFGLRFLVLWHAIWGTRPPISHPGGRALLHDWAFSSEKARRELGYAWVPFEEGFPEFVRWFASLPVAGSSRAGVTGGPAHAVAAP